MQEALLEISSTVSSFSVWRTNSAVFELCENYFHPIAYAQIAVTGREFYHPNRKRANGNRIARPSRLNMHQNYWNAALNGTDTR